ncbi:MAG TPA: hypothetical protein PLF81_03835 [Candidatus Anammoximicrobium sp.]|nr:hypothetical protein [Candidatus Anammoximicrobium sp.]
MTSNQQLDPRLTALLSRLRWRIRVYVWLEGLALGVIWLGLTFWIALALDYLPVLAGASEMPRAARAVVLAIVAAGLAYILFHWVFRRAFVPLANRSMAVLLERRFGMFRDSLVTSVELTERPDHAETFDASMLAHTSQEALSDVDRVRLGAVFNFRPLARSVFGAAILLGTVVVFYAQNQQALAVWVHRAYLLRDEAWPRSALIEVVGVELLGPEDAPQAATEVPLIPFRDGSLKVAKGSNLRLKVRAALKAKVVPQTCTIHYRTADGQRGRVTMNRMKRSRDEYQQYTFSGKPLQGILTTVQFDVVGYDYRVRDFTIQVVDSPAIVGVDLDCKFPGYMVDEKAGSWLPRTVAWTSSTQLPRGTEVTIRAHTNKPLKRVDLYLLDTQETRRLDEFSPTDPQQFAFPAGRLDANLTLDVTLFDTDDVVTERPYRIFITAIPDEAPRVDVRLRGIGTAVTPDVMIPARGTISDDYGVDKSWFDMILTRATVAENEQKDEPLVREFPLAKGGQVEAEVDFRALRSQANKVELRPKDKLTLAIRAADKCGWGEGPNVGSGDRYQLDVVTPETLLAMLEAREIGLRRRFEQIVQEMTQARDLLIRVQAPSQSEGVEPGDVDRPGREPGDKAVDERKAAERAQSLRVLRVQQTLQQTRKSAQELLGVAAGFHDIREELINNRVDTEDRKKRLKELIADPMQLIGQTMFPELERREEVLEKLLLDDLAAKKYDLGSGQQETAAAVTQANDVLAEMEKILQQMLDLETFNELLDIVRQLMDEQQRVMGETQKAHNELQKNLLRDLE